MTTRITTIILIAVPTIVAITMTAIVITIAVDEVHSVHHHNNVPITVPRRCFAREPERYEQRYKEQHQQVLHLLLLLDCWNIHNTRIMSFVNIRFINTYARVYKIETPYNR